MRKALLLFGLAIGIAWLAAATALAAPYYLRDGVAADGYDTVAYFTEGKAVKGDAKFQHAWDGAKWHFSSAANRDRFAADPVKYAPQYGGFCAYGVASGYKVKVIGEAWHVRDGKLYLNYDKSVQKRWLADIPGHIAKAEDNWPKIKDK
jgi:YHS domain-containing protein